MAFTMTPDLQLYDFTKKKICEETSIEYKKSVAESTQYTITKMLSAFFKHHIKKEIDIKALTLVGKALLQTIHKKLH